MPSNIPAAERGASSCPTLGTFLAADVIDHRNLSAEAGRAIVRSLREWAAELEADGSIAGQLGDRLIVCREGLDAEEFVGRARSLRSRIADASANIDADSRTPGVRIALHCGLFQEEKGLAFGPGPTDCGRLTAYADRSTIVCSGQFAGVWAEKAGASIYACELWPKLGRVPLGTEQQHWRPGGIQLGLREPPDLNLFLLQADPAARQLEPPERLVDMHVMEARLFELCDQIRTQFLESLDLPRETDTERGEVRVRLFVRVDEQPPRQPRLVATKFESGIDVGARQESVAGTQYEKLSQRGWEGPLGRALVTGEVQVTPVLPDPDKDPEAYVEALSTAPWKIRKEKIRGFGRKARRFLAVPLQVGISQEDLVLCIDFGSHPLEGIAETGLRDQGLEIQAACGYEIAALFALRTA